MGIADVVPKTIAYRLLAPALSVSDPARILCREINLANLLAELALHRVDMVIADGPIPAGINVRGYSHVLGECGISFLVGLTAGCRSESLKRTDYQTLQNVRGQRCMAGMGSGCRELLVVPVEAGGGHESAKIVRRRNRWGWLSLRA